MCLYLPLHWHTGGCHCLLRLDRPGDRSDGQDLSWGWQHLTLRLNLNLSECLGLSKCLSLYLRLQCCLGLHGCLHLLCRLEKNLGLARMGLSLDRRHGLRQRLRLGRYKCLRRLHLWRAVPLVLEMGGCFTVTRDWYRLDLRLNSSLERNLGLNVSRNSLNLSRNLSGDLRGCLNDARDLGLHHRAPMLMLLLGEQSLLLLY